MFLKHLYSVSLSLTSNVCYKQFSPEIPLVLLTLTLMACVLLLPESLVLSHPPVALHCLAKSARVSAPSLAPLWSQEAE